MYSAYAEVKILTVGKWKLLLQTKTCHAHFLLIIFFSLNIPGVCDVTVQTGLQLLHFDHTEDVDSKVLQDKEQAASNNITLSDLQQKMYVNLLIEKRQ
jgi:hypothetical protein